MRPPVAVRRPKAAQTSRKPRHGRVERPGRHFWRKRRNRDAQPLQLREAVVARRQPCDHSLHELQLGRERDFALESLSGDLAGEFRRLMENIGMGMAFDSALEKMYERMPTAELRFFSIVMNVQQKTGGNLAEALGNLSGVLRARKLMREKIKALSSEATASAMIIGCLPPGVVVMISVTQPTYMQPMWHDNRGHLMLMAGVFWMSTGIFVMRRMINFKF